MTSRSGRNSPAKERYSALLSGDKSRESPLRSNRQPAAHQETTSDLKNTAAGNTNTNEEDSKLDHNAFMMHHASSQKSNSAYGGNG